jgi:signal transduction histidine kinase
MTGKMKNLLQSFGNRSNRRFLQPVAVALVFLLFALLFSSTAMMDLRRLELLLLDGLKSKAVYIAEVVEQSSHEKLGRILLSANGLQSLDTGFNLDDETFFLQESVARVLIDAARFVDSLELADTGTDAELKHLTGSDRLQAIAIFDESGRAIFESHPLPPNLNAHVQDLLQGGDEIAIHLFHGMNREGSVGFVAVRRHSGKGAVVLVLDAKGVDHWARRVAIQSSLEEQQLGKGVVYLAVEDLDGQIIAGSGKLPEEKIQECLLTATAARVPEDAMGQCVRVGEMKLLELALPLHLNGSSIGTIHVGIESHDTDRLLLENRWHISLWAGLMGVIGLIAMAVLYQTQNRHVARLQAMRERLHQAEKLSALGKLGAGVAHEIRNPLNAISLAVQRLRKEFRPDDPDRREPYERITQILRDEIQRLNSIVEEFLSLSRTSKLDLRPQPVIPLLEKTLSLFQEEAESRGVELRRRWDGGEVAVRMDGHKMEQALLNILRNALESTMQEGVVVVSCDQPREGMMRIRIRDNGRGIPEGEAGRIFEPFHTTKSSGVGLGLAIAHEIIAAHGGEIRVTSRSGVGTTFEILLPPWEGE